MEYTEFLSQASTDEDRRVNLTEYLKATAEREKDLVARLGAVQQAYHLSAHNHVTQWRDCTSISCQTTKLIIHGPSTQPRNDSPRITGQSSA